MKRAVADRTMTSGLGGSDAEEQSQQSLKAEANSAYSKGELTRAIELYSQAIDLPVAYEDLPSEAPR